MGTNNADIPPFFKSHGESMVPRAYDRLKSTRTQSFFKIKLTRSKSEDEPR